MSGRLSSDARKAVSGYMKRHPTGHDKASCGTKRADGLLLAGGSSIAGSGQQYCWLEAAIAKQASLYRTNGTSVPHNWLTGTMKEAE